MDAFAVSVCMGLSMKKAKSSVCLSAGLYFGAFQFVMPVIGYLAGAQFADKITSIDHWIAFLLLGLIGGKMIKDSFEKEHPADKQEVSVSPKRMLPLAVATSLDALAVGISFAFLNVEIIPAASFIGGTTFVLSILGVLAGSAFGVKYKSKAELAGGVILVIIGIKTLVEHLGIL